MIKNFTPHPIHILDLENRIVEEFAPAGLVRLKATTEPDEPISGIPTSRTVFGEPEGLPAKEERVWLIVSQLVKTALPDRDDLLVPAEVQRDDKGNIIGCWSLGR